jgi:hypothetical protein
MVCLKLPKYHHKYVSESRDPGSKSTWRWLLPACGSGDQHREYDMSHDISLGTYHEVGTVRNIGLRSSAGKGRFATHFPLRIAPYSSGFSREPGSTGAHSVAGTVSRSTFGRSGTYTLQCNLNPLVLDADMLHKRKCIYEKNVSTRPGTAKSTTAQQWQTAQTEQHSDVGEQTDSINSMMWW